MTVHRFFAARLAAGPLTLEPQEAAHAARVLRLRPGDALLLFDGRGGRATAYVTNVAKMRGEACVMVEAAAPTRDPAPMHTLRMIVAGCKRDRMEWLVEKCTELGATEIALTEFTRSVVHATEHRIEKLERIAIEACKQCGRAWKPELTTCRSPADALRERALTLLADPSLEAEPILTTFPTTPPQPSHTQIVIGPEGGLTPEERTLLVAGGARPVRLALDILRVETAAVAAAAAWSAWRCGIEVQSAP